MAEDMFRQGPLWVDSGYRGDSVRQTPTLAEVLDRVIFLLPKKLPIS